jgi:hypothetical protein
MLRAFAFFNFVLWPLWRSFSTIHSIERIKTSVRLVPSDAIVPRLLVFFYHYSWLRRPLDLLFFFGGTYFFAAATAAAASAASTSDGGTTPCTTVL